MSWEVKSSLEGKNSLYNFEKLAKNPFFVVFFKKAIWKLLKIVSHVEFCVPVCLARSELMPHFDEGSFENPCGVRPHSASEGYCMPAQASGAGGREEAASRRTRTDADGGGFLVRLPRSLPPQRSAIRCTIHYTTEQSAFTR